MPRVAATATQAGFHGRSADRLGSADGMASTIPPPEWAVALAGGDSNTSASRSQGFECTLRVERSAAMASVSLTDAAGLTAAEFDEAAGRMISVAFSMLSKSHAPHPVRVWNFLPGIHTPMLPGLDRYRAFNVARYRALGSILGESALRSGAVPTASCVGHRGSGMSVHVLGAVAPGRPIENPRQVPAFAYSTRFGPRPPCFARATVASFHGAPLLMVAGTASVLGEESVHPDSAPAQLAETLINLQTVLTSAQGGSAVEHLVGLTSTRVYIRSNSVRRQVADHLPASLTSGQVEWLQADICREELLLEIEVVVGLPAD